MDMMYNFGSWRMRNFIRIQKKKKKKKKKKNKRSVAGLLARGNQFPDILE